MIAGTHWFNMGLHEFGLTSIDEDAMHAEYMTKALRTKIALVSGEMLSALDEIENYRALFVRGNAPGGEAAARRCLTLLDAISDIADAAKPRA